MVLQLQTQHQEQIAAQAEQLYPEECCGLMIGLLDHSSQPETRRVVEIWPTQNTWTADVMERDGIDDSPSETSDLGKERRFWIDPKELLVAQKYAREHKLDIIGIYHSHPDHVAVPSECDRTFAWPQYSYLIVSVQQGKAQDYQSWTLDDQHQFQAEEIITLEFQVREPF